MSSALAIAAVTAVLKDLLNNGFIDNDLTAALGGRVTVTTRSPDHVEIDAREASQLNLFLYQVTPNIGWRNVDLPSRDTDGRRTSNPPLAIDLHYLLTAYGKEEFHAEIMLGYAMQLLHENALLTRDAIRTALGSGAVSGGGILPPALAILPASSLADQVEMIKIVPQVLSTEEMSRLWSAFQAHYRPTAAYQASVVLIDSSHATRSAPPVRTRTVRVMPFRQPVIEDVWDEKGPEQPITATSTLAIRGKRLRGEVTRVRIGDVDVVPPPPVRDSLIRLPLSSLAAGVVRAGVQGLQVIQPVLLGFPPAPHRGFESNVAAFVLRPLVQAQLDGPATPTTVNGVTTHSGTMKLTLAPKIGKTQRLRLLLDQLLRPQQPPSDQPGTAYSFDGPPDNGITQPNQLDTDVVSVPFAGVGPGTYLVRVQVDGAESPLDVDADPTSLTFNLYVGTPKVTIP
jgi:hypothetical protein